LAFGRLFMSALRFSLQERPAGSLQCPGEGSAVRQSGESQIKDALDKVHAGTDSLSWALIGYVGDSTDSIELIGAGTDMTEIYQYLVPDRAIYALVRMVDIVDNIPTNRFAYIFWVGDALSGVKKARMATNKANIMKIIGHFNVELTASSHDEITPEVIEGKIRDASGSRIREKEIVSHPPKTTGAGSGAGAGKAAAGGSSAPKSAVNTSSGCVLKWENEAAMRQALADVRDDSNPTSWTLLHYKGRELVGLSATGTGDVAELAAHLKANEVMYGLFRVNDIVDSSVTVKFFYVNWVGEEVNAMTKGRIATHKGQIEEFFQPYHISIFGTTIEDISPAIVTAKLQELKGSKA